MMKLALIVIAMILCNDLSLVDLGWTTQLRDYGMALLVALLLQPWVVEQIDS